MIVILEGRENKNEKWKLRFTEMFMYVMRKMIFSRLVSYTCAVYLYQIVFE